MNKLSQGILPGPFFRNPPTLVTVFTPRSLTSSLTRDSLGRTTENFQVVRFDCTVLYH